MSLFDSIMVMDWPVLAAGLAAIVFVILLLRRFIVRLFK